jgi:hypothetical protein
MKSLRGCARCGGAHVDTIEWRLLTRPIIDGDGTTWTHWCPCPTNGEPILMRKAPTVTGSTPGTPANPIIVNMTIRPPENT